MAGAQAKDHPMEILTCPFCEFTDEYSDILIQHIDYCHPENTTTGVQEQPIETQLQDDTPPDDEEQYLECPHGCGEVLHKDEIQVHLDLHVAETVALDDTGGLQSPEGHELPNGRKSGRSGKSGKKEQSPDSDLDDPVPMHGRDVVVAGKTRKRRKRRSAHSGSGPVKRLGRSELGPYAHEKQMPSWLRKMLEESPKITYENKLSSTGTVVRVETVENETKGVIPVLKQLCRQDPTVERVMFCSPLVRHIFKLPREGGFCGYRNIQMLISHIQEAQKPGHEKFPGRTPSILKLQDMIERAWDMGFDEFGRTETGGIKGTRKYIGTPEAQALFLSLDIKCSANAFITTPQRRAYEALFESVAKYFREGCSNLESGEKILETDLPPIYLQHRGHSVTIVGFEVTKSGTADLLVFDPMYKTSPAVRRLIDQGSNAIQGVDATKVLQAWRRGAPYLQKYKGFEILMLE